MNPSPPDLFPQRPVRSDFGRTPSYRTRRIITVLVLLLLIGGLRCIGPSGGPSISHPGEIPTIKAETGAWKQKPEQPGGIDIPHQDVQVYQALDGKDAAKPEVEHLLPPPETPQSAMLLPWFPVMPGRHRNSDAKILRRRKAENLAPPPLQPKLPLRLLSRRRSNPKRSRAPRRRLIAGNGCNSTARRSLCHRAAGCAQTVKTMAQVLKDLPARRTADHAVQLASVQDETSAHDMMEKLQTRYASVLGDAQLRLVKADLGAKGVFYRIQQPAACRRSGE